MTEQRPTVAVIGAGEIGRGWAALTVSQGWRTALYDTDTGALTRAQEDVVVRAERLAVDHFADSETAQEGIRRLTLARSLLQAVEEADWVIEATPEDLAGKQRALEHIEQVCRLKAVVTSSSSGLTGSDLVARLRRPERMLVAHPLNPVELIPLVEVMPSPLTQESCTDLVCFWLEKLGRIPVVLRKEIAGGIAGRIAAAVWRQCIQLVLDGVVDVEDVDIAVQMGPCLGWTAAGPNLTYHLGAGNHGVAVFLANLLGTFEQYWQDLPTWTQLSAEEQHRLVKAIEKAYGDQLPVLRSARDLRLIRVLNALSEEE